MENNAEPQGIGGWLLLPMLGLILTPLQTGTMLATIHMPVIFGDTWDVLTTPGSDAYHYLWAPLLILEALGNAALFVSALVLLVLFFQKHFMLPGLMVAFYVFNVAFMGADFFAAGLIPALASQQDPEALKGLVKAIVGASIWVPYFLNSARVQNTFTNGRVEQDIAVT